MFTIILGTFGYPQGLLARLKQLNLNLGTRSLMGPLQGIRLTRLPLLTAVWRGNSQLTVVTLGLGNGKLVCFTPIRCT